MKTTTILNSSNIKIAQHKMREIYTIYCILQLLKVRIKSIKYRREIRIKKSFKYDITKHEEYNSAEAINYNQSIKFILGS